MPWQKTPEEIAADEWELAGAYVQAVINVIPELSSEELKRNGFDARDGPTRRGGLTMPTQRWQDSQDLTRGGRCPPR